MAFGDSAGLLFKIKADATQASSEIKKFEAGLLGMNASVTSSLTSFASSAAAGVAAIAAVSGAVVIATKELYNLASAAGEYGSKIHDAAQQTGLTVESVQALKFAAEQSGSSFEAINGSIAKFSVLLGDAKNRNEKALATLKQYGITATDTDGALQQAIKSIASMTDHDKQAAAAKALFRERTAAILPVIQSFDGDMPSLIAHLRDLGILMSKDDTDAADKFGDQMDELGKQFTGVKIKLGTELMPLFTDWAKQLGDWLKSNPGEVKAWGQTFVTVLQAVGNAVQILVTDFQILNEWSSNLINTPKYYELLDKLAVLEQKDKNFWAGTNIPLGTQGVNDQVNELTTPIDRTKITPHSNTPFGTGDTGGDTGSAAKEIFKLSPKGQAIVDAANKLGISPLDLATIIGFETAGTYSPSKRGGEGNKFLGLIQFGPEEQKQFGVTAGQSFADQMKSVVAFFEQRFGKVGQTTQGASILDLYRTVLGGSPTASLTAKDAFGTSAISGVAKMLQQTRPDALAKFFGGKTSNVPGNQGSEIAGFTKQAQAELDKQLEEQKKYEEARVAAIKKASDEAIALFTAEGDKRIAILKAQLDAGIISEREYVVRVGLIQLDRLKAERDRTTDANQRAILEQRIAQQIIENEAAEAAAIRKSTEEEKKRHEERNKSWSDYVRQIREAQDEIDDLNAREAERRARQRQEYLQQQAGFLGQSVITQFDAAGNAVANLHGAFDELKKIGGEALQQFAQGIGQLVQNFVLLGDAGPKAMQKLVASILAQVASQAAVLAIMELAYGIAALTPWGAAVYGSAALHFKAAALFGAVAAGAALAGRAVAGNSFRNQTGAATGRGGGTGQGSGADQNPQAYSRSSATAFDSGQRSFWSAAKEQHEQTMGAIRDLISTNRELNNKIGSMRPGDVLTRGAAEKPGFIGNQAVSDVRRDSSIGKNLGRSMGMS